MQLTLEAPSLRGYAEVRRIIDEALGDGIGMSAATAYGKLPAVARAAWFVEMLGAHAVGSMHLHSQQFSTGELDGPMLLARLAEAVRPLEPVAAEFCRWVAERGAAHRRAGPNDVISTVVFALWRARATDVIRTSASRSGDEIGGVHDHAVGIGARRSDDLLSDGALGRCAADAKADRLERRGDLVEARRLEARVVCGDYAGLDAEISAGARDRETPA